MKGPRVMFYSSIVLILLSVYVWLIRLNFPLSLMHFYTDLGSVQVTITYLPFFGAVCASVSSLNLTDIPETEAATLIEKSSLLHCLFEGDTGCTSPNSLVSYHIRKKGWRHLFLGCVTVWFPVQVGAACLWDSRQH